jgi:uncharacterized protein
VPPIRAALDDLPVRVLYAVESGSRAWGFASPDSDYDVRFLYVHPRSAYLSIERPPETLDRMLPGDIDLAGWDLRKALGLLRKSNPSLLEWLRTPLVYAETEGFRAELDALADAAFSPAAGFHHYRSMAETNARDWLQGDLVRPKKYLYVLRAVLAARWIESGRGRPPVEFDHLRPVLPASVNEAVDLLLAEKRRGFETDAAPRRAALHDWLESERARLATVRPEPTEPIGIEALDDFFRRWIAS